MRDLCSRLKRVVALVKVGKIAKLTDMSEENGSSKPDPRGEFGFILQKIFLSSNLFKLKRGGAYSKVGGLLKGGGYSRVGAYSRTYSSQTSLNSLSVEYGRCKYKLADAVWSYMKVNFKALRWRLK